MSSSPSTADCVELFQGIGLSESKAKETAKNQTGSDSLVFLLTKVLVASQHSSFVYRPLLHQAQDQCGGHVDRPVGTLL